MQQLTYWVAIRQAGKLLISGKKAGDDQGPTILLPVDRIETADGGKIAAFVGGDQVADLL